MGALADIYVRILADDGAAQRTIRKFRGDMDDLGRKTTNAKVGVDTKGADAQVRALKARLAALEKTQINIPIKTSKIDAEIAVTKAKLDRLNQKVIEVDVTLKGSVEKDIKKTEASLARLEKRRVEIPLTIDRAAAEITAVKAQLATLERTKIRIPVIADLDAKSVQQVSAQMAGLLKLPALAAAAGLAGGAIASLSAGLFSMGAAAAPAFGSVAAGAGSLLALGQGAGVAKLALGGVADAVKAVTAAQTAAAAGYEPTDKQIQKIAETYGLSGAAAKDFVKQIISSQDALGSVRKAAQRELFPALTSSLKTLTTGLLPTFRAGAAETAVTLGGLAKQGAKLLTSGPFKRDFTTLMSANTGILYTFGQAGFSLVDIFRNLAVAAIPLTERFAKFVAKSAAAAQSFVQIQRDGGGLGRFFKTAGDTAAQLGRILANVVVSIFNVGKAGFSSGQSLLTSFEKATKKLRELTGSVEGQNKLKVYFENAAEVTREAGRLINDVALGLAKLGGNKNLAPLISQFRTQLLPVIQDLLSTVGSEFGPKVINLLTTLVGTFKRLTSGGGALSGFVGTLNTMAQAMNKILDSPLGPVVKQILVLAGSAAAIGLVAGSLGRVAAALSIVGKGAGVVLGPLARLIFGTSSLRLIALKLFETLGKVAGFLAKNWPRVVALAGRALTGLWAIMAANPVGATIAILLAVGVAFVVAYRKSEKFRSVVQAVWKGIKLAFTGAWAVIQVVFAGVVKRFQAVGRIAISFGKTVALAWAGIRAATTAAWNAITGRIQSAMSKVGSILRGAKRVIGSIWSSIIDVVKAPIRGLFRFINRPLISSINSVTGKFGIPKIPSLNTKFAQGGPVRGPGGPTADAIPARLSNGEFVVRASAAAKHLPLLHAINDGGPQGFAQGGLAQGGLLDPFVPKLKTPRQPQNTDKYLPPALQRLRDTGQLIQSGMEDLARKVLLPIVSKMRDKFSGNNVVTRVPVEAMAGLVERIITVGRNNDSAAATSGGIIGTGQGSAPAYNGPIAFPLRPGSYTVGSPYGPRNGRLHGGQDFPSYVGTPVYSPIGGYYTQRRDPGGFGNYGNVVAGAVRFIAGHLSKFAGGPGRVHAGQLIGYVGNTGRSTGPHLHAEFRVKGRPVNPRQFLKYDQGGLMMPGAGGVNLGKRPERVLSSKQTDAFDRLIATLEKGGSGAAGRGSFVGGDLVVQTTGRKTDGLDVAKAVFNRAALNGWS